MQNAPSERKTLLERVAAKVPDPVVLFISFFAILFAATCFVGGKTFAVKGAMRNDPAEIEKKFSVAGVAKSQLETYFGAPLETVAADKRLFAQLAPIYTSISKKEKTKEDWFGAKGEKRAPAPSGPAPEAAKTPDGRPAPEFIQIETARTIKNMSDRPNVQWLFDNAIVGNWLAYAKGVIGMILIAMFGIGLTESSGLFSVLMRLAGRHINEKLLPYVIVFAGVISNIASDAGYIVLIPLAGALYCAIGRNPLIGIAAAFAGVSAGFGANFVPATVTDMLVGVPAEEFAVSQGVPWISRMGEPLQAATMDYFYTATLVVVFTLLGGFVTNRIISPKLSRLSWTVPEDMKADAYKIDPKEVKDLRWALLGLVLALGIAAFFGWGPLEGHFAHNVILFVGLGFFMTGLFYGIAQGRFHKVEDIIGAMTKQVKEMAYMMVLTFFCYNFLAMLTYSEVGAYITFSGARALLAMHLESSPVLILLGFILFSSLVNICIAGLSSKWLLLGPIFIPMLYQVNNGLTPEVVAAAYRTADPCTNVITPAMTYAGVILIFCRRYRKEFTIGDLGLMMFPYAGIFLFVTTCLFLAWFKLGIPFGF